MTGSTVGVPLAAAGYVVQDQSRIQQYLQDPRTHGATDPVKKIDTQSASVFLVGDHAYKLKRAVRLPFMDFSTIDRRRRACEAEIAINRPAAPEVYLGALPITEHDGVLSIGGEGDIVDWVVHMRRFDESQTLDRVAERSGLAPELVSSVVDVVLASHARAPVRDGSAAISSLETTIKQNDEAFTGLPDLFPIRQAQRLTPATNDALECLRPILMRRAESGFVRRCHGDLHLRNIVLVNDVPTLFDAIEFDDAVATVDVLYDLAFLIMDLWQRKLRQQANAVLNQYLWGSDEAHLDGLAAVPLFLSLRTAIRAKVVAAALPHLDGDERSTAQQTARDYFRLALEFLAPPSPRLVAIGGLSGTGKSTLAASLAPSLGRPPGAVHLRSDVGRKRYMRSALTAKLPAPAYSREITDLVYSLLRSNAARVLDAGHSVIVDAVQATEEERSSLAVVAEQRGFPFTGLWLEADLDERLQRSAKRFGDVSDADEAVVRRQDAYDVGSVTWTHIDAAGDKAEVSAKTADVLGLSTDA